MFHFIVMNNISYIKSERGKDKLILKGYIYVLEKQGFNKLIWKCENYQKIKCKGRLHVCNDEIIKEFKHNHVPDCAKVEVWKTINELKEKAIERPDLKTRAVLGTISTSVSTLI